MSHQRPRPLREVSWKAHRQSGAAQTYYEQAQGVTPDIERVEVPTAIAVFPHDLGGRPPREWVERTYNLTRYTTMPRGGHFAAREEPGLLADDLAAFFSELA